MCDLSFLIELSICVLNRLKERQERENRIARLHVTEFPDFANISQDSY